jgi:hypothetical protein
MMRTTNGASAIAAEILDSHLRRGWCFSEFLPTAPRRAQGLARRTVRLIILGFRRARGHVDSKRRPLPWSALNGKCSTDQRHALPNAQEPK